MTTFAPGVVVPVTVTEEDSMTTPGAGAVIEMGTLAGGVVHVPVRGDRRLFEGASRADVEDEPQFRRPGPDSGAAEPRACRRRTDRRGWGRFHTARPPRRCSPSPARAPGHPDEKSIIAMSNGSAVKVPEPMSDSGLLAG
jgi:hypothetical protein